ncbi:hypothetical protein BVG79_00296 [Ketogulonicigenium robustum]|uniref:Uncharacterized protein n=1 Tax=Ketogulonicigenium robustum TaxID=92947 RepID=A0A1W6NWR1_9RHOB|nr:hypothetical protein [Ketogulonicigenium robustum]ARO13654.1 hypothetical protein BVG79_00296 [Ketogulonicigenium robustum]
MGHSVNASVGQATVSPLPLNFREGVLPNRSHMLRMAASLGSGAFRAALHDDASELERRLLRLSALAPDFQPADVVRDVGVVAEVSRRFGILQVDQVATAVIATLEGGDNVAFAATLRRLMRLGNSALFLLACQLPD